MLLPSLGRSPVASGDSGLLSLPLTLGTGGYDVDAPFKSLNPTVRFRNSPVSLSSLLQIYYSSVKKKKPDLVMKGGEGLFNGLGGPLQRAQSAFGQPQVSQNTRS